MDLKISLSSGQLKETHKIKEVRKSVLGDFDLPDVPQAFTDAFNEGEEDDSSD